MTLDVRTVGPALFAAAFLAACTVPTDPADDPEQEDPPLVEGGDVALGGAAFEEECASCHASRDGFDLAHFSFSDTTILRRALGHVDSTTAIDIVAYIRSLDVSRRSRDERVFQPGGEILSSDVEFAQRLFGADRLPADLTTAQLRAMDPRNIPIAIPFPLWSDESSNMDWMPDDPFPTALLDYNQGAARQKLDEYYRTSSVQDFTEAIIALAAADRVEGNSAAPCVEGVGRLRPEDCFDARRWVASFGAQFMMRHGFEAPLHTGLHDLWWDIGHVSRRTVLADGFEGDIDNALENWVTWMYAGWAFAPERHASFYLAAGFARSGLHRHGTFHMLRSQVARPAGSVAPYVDAANIPRYGADSWVADALTFAYEHLLSRLDVGDRPNDDRDQARAEVQNAYELALPRVTSEEAQALAALRNLLLTRI